LIALDQMPQSKLTREQLTPLLSTDDAKLLKAALDVVASRPEWGAEITGLLREWIQSSRLEVSRRDNLRDLLIGLSTDAAIQKLIHEGLDDKTTAMDTRLTLLESIARAPLAKTPPAWVAALGRALADADERVTQQGIAALRARNLPDFSDTLHRLARDAKRLPETRVAALALAAPRLSSVDPDLFSFLLRELAPEQAPLHRLAVAQALAQSKLDDDQLLRLSGALPTAGAMEMPHLLAAFEGKASDTVGFALVKSLSQAPGLASLSPAALERATRGFAKPVQDQARLLVKKLSIDVAQQKLKLDELEPATKGGDVDLGRNVFYGPKATCAACHAVGGRGGAIGPDLTKIGAIRSGRDLLESLVFPSASFARGFESFVVETKAGKVHQGVMARETADALVLVNADRHETRVLRSEIDSITPGRVSIMPQGLEAQLSRQELQNLLAFLQSLR